MKNNPFHIYDKDDPHYTLPLSGQAVGFLVWLRHHYGQFIAGSYIDIASAYGQIRYGAARVLIIELIEKGYLILRNPDRKHRKYKIDDEKYKELCHIPEVEPENKLTGEEDEDI